jgi:predicted exporter
MQSIFDGLRILLDFTCCGLAGTAIVLVFLLVWVRSMM